jgi:uncharacterized protein HemY
VIVILWVLLAFYAGVLLGGWCRAQKDDDLGRNER